MNRLLGVLKVLVVFLAVVTMTIGSALLVVWFENFERDYIEKMNHLSQFSSKNNGDKQIKLEPNVTCLVLGRNQSLTDFIVLVQYNPNVREISMMSIPRDSFVGSSSMDGKINSIYATKGKGIQGVKDKVKEITGIEVNYYVLFDAKILKKIVDELGGVTVEVPINMDYDDPYQSPPLHIHLKKGIQRLNGDQAEQFVRFRKNNNGTGYANGDVGRIATQQKFIKAMINEVLKSENISKVKKLAQIVLDGTKTDITAETIEKYIGEVVTFKADRVRMSTLPGTGKYMQYGGYTRSYYVIDEEAAKQEINMLFKKTLLELNASSGDNITISNANTYDNDVKLTETFGESIGENDEPDDNEKIKIELLIAKAKNSKVTELANKLSENNCNVIKLGNYNSTEIEKSRIITYGYHTDEELEMIKNISGIKKVETSDEESSVKFTIILGVD